jgi:hypothetical protein
MPLPLVSLAEMPARDVHHDAVRNALSKDGWTITHDPFVLKWGTRDLFVDLGAERLLAAEKGTRKIAVEVKGFTGPSEMVELERALGQYLLYQDVLAERDPDRVLYLAVPAQVMDELFDEPIGRLLLRNQRVRLVVFGPREELIVRWIP